MKLYPILKWAGGKTSELKYILPKIPKFQNYYEPFVGAGAVYFSLNNDKNFINDKSWELINLYNAIKKQNRFFFNTLQIFNDTWKTLSDIVKDNSETIIKTYKNFTNKNIDESLNNLNILTHIYDDYNILSNIQKSFISKMKRMKKLEIEKGLLSDNDILDNIESSFKSGYYTFIRELYNEKSLNAAIFYFIRINAYSGMFRYNKKGKFNVPYGGIGYNKNNLDKKIEYFKSEELINHLQKTIIENLDFEIFLNKYNPTKNDFIFLDPPYDSEFNTYSQNEFTNDDQIRLSNYLINCEAKWMLVIKHTDFIYNLYNKNNIYINSFDKSYSVNFKNRNNKNVNHLIITNYI